MTWVIWNLASFRLETVLASVQDRCMVCAQNSFWMPSMVPLVDEAQVEARFGPIEHGANLDAKLVHGSRLTYHRLGNRFGRTRCNS